jgi:anti-sigma B factor antagonist
MPGQVRTLSRGERAVVQVLGDLDIASAPDFRAEIDRLVRHDQLDVLVDLTEVSFIDSTGISALIATLKGLRKSGGGMELVLDNAKLLKIFRVAGLTGVFAIYPDLDSALQEPL